MAATNQQDDLMSALQMPFDDPAIEAKFNALKRLQVLKVKSLMTSLDAIKKENEKLKALGKDSRRTQMIQNLRVKVKNQEVMNDVLKDMLVIGGMDESKEDDFKEPIDTRRKFYSREEVNKFLIDKSAGAPKRFRPKTREELENEITKFQKENEKMKKSLSQQQRVVRQEAAVAVGSDAKGSGSRVSGYRAESKGQPKAEAKAAVRIETESKDKEKLIESMKIIKLMDDMSELQAELKAKDEEIASYQQENANLRTSLSSNDEIGEKLRHKQKQYDEMRDMYEKTSDELDDTSTALALAREEVVQVRAEADAENEALKATIDRLNNSLEATMKQNKSMLDEIHKTERLNASTPSLTNPIPTRSSAPSAAASIIEPPPISTANDAATVASSSPSQEDRKTMALTSKETKVYEQKISHLRQKLADSESKLRELQEEPKKVISLMEELRSKNEVIRELKRNINEMSRPSRSNDNNNNNVISEELVGNLYDEVKRLKSEIDRLKQQRSSTAPSPKRSPVHDNNNVDDVESFQDTIAQLKQENNDLIAELSDMNSRLDKTGGFSDAAKLANTLVEGFKNVLIDIHDKVVLDNQSHALDAMSDCKVEGEMMVKVDDPSIDRDKLIELLEVFEFFFEEHGGNSGGNVDRNHRLDGASTESKSRHDDDDDAVPGSPFNT